jgi:ATP-dependent RNA helicase DDX3X
LFSATFVKAARDLAREYLAGNHVRFRVGRAGQTTASIKQVVIQVERHEKREVLVQVLTQHPGVRTIIFVNSRVECDSLDAYLFNMGLPVTSMHSDRSQLERESALRAFRAAQLPIMISTTVAGRGIDVKNVMHVINYDLPSTDHGGIEEYTHRIGRTGRIGHQGTATSLYCEERDEPLASVLTRTLMETRQEIPPFLEQYMPESGKLKFEADSDFDEDEAAPSGVQEGGESSGNSWGASGAANDNSGQEAQTGGWGAPAKPPARETTNSWGALASQPDQETTNGWGSADSSAGMTSQTQAGW